MTQVGTTGTGTSVGGGMSAAGSAVNARADALVADARRSKANFEAAQRGEYGGGRAAVVSDAREWVDHHVKGDPAAASAADQRANHWGRAAAYAHPGMLGREACDVFRPRGLDARY